MSFILTMASKPSAYNTDNKGKKKYKHKKITILCNTIGFSDNNLSSDSCINNNLPGCQNFIYLQHPKPLLT